MLIFLNFFYNMEKESSSRQEGLPIRHAAQVKDKMLLQKALWDLHREDCIENLLINSQ